MSLPRGIIEKGNREKKTGKNGEDRGNNFANSENQTTHIFYYKKVTSSVYFTKKRKKRPQRKTAREV